jgi:hypothetical protein
MVNLNRNMLGQKNTSCIQPNESAYGHGHPLCLSEPQQTVSHLYQRI